MLHAERTLAMGLTDQAEKLYRQALEQDARNAIAVVGLARVALARDDDRSAYDLAVEALRIDPENAAALRLEVRLSEVLAARGEPVQRERFVLDAVAAERRRAERELEAAARNAPRAEPGRPDYAPTPGTRFAAIAEAQERGRRAAAPEATEPPPAGPEGPTPRRLLRRLFGR
jgi:tetratricopeptide (TPR) repeat protein